LPKKQRQSICILDEAVVGRISDGRPAHTVSTTNGGTSATTLQFVAFQRLLRLGGWRCGVTV